MLLLSPLDRDTTPHAGSPVAEFNTASDSGLGCVNSKPKQIIVGKLLVKSVFSFAMHSFIITWSFRVASVQNTCSLTI